MIASPRLGIGAGGGAVLAEGGAEAATASFSTTSREIISPATLAKRLTRPTIFTKPSSLDLHHVAGLVPAGAGRRGRRLENARILEAQ
jgi:hypothetical protein